MSLPIALLAAAQIVTASPDNSIAISIADDGSAFSVSRRAEPLLVDSPLGLDLSGEALGRLELKSVKRRAISQSLPLVATKQGFEVVQAVPTAWDETRFVGGAPESYVALARRAGTTWYLGVMNSEESRSIDLPLGFLPKGRFSAKIWADGAAPTEIVGSSRAVDRDTLLKMDLKGSGGSVIVIEPR